MTLLLLYRIYWYLFLGFTGALDLLTVLNNGMKSNWVFLCKIFFGFDLNYGTETNLSKLGAWLPGIMVGKIFPDGIHKFHL